MATQSQIDANRRNAQKSTGPTPEGRDAVRHNTLKHGLTAQLLLPSKEEQIELDRLCDAFETEFQPVGPTEESLLENLVAAKWRLGFARKAETGFFMKRAFELINDESSDCRDLLTNSRLAVIVDLDSAGPDTLSKLSRYEARLERSFYKALSELRRTQSERQPAEAPAAKKANPRSSRLNLRLPASGLRTRSHPKSEIRHPKSLPRPLRNRPNPRISHPNPPHPQWPATRLRSLNDPKSNIQQPTSNIRLRYPIPKELLSHLQSERRPAWFHLSAIFAARTIQSRP